jgi:hypothetical protein
VYKKIGKMNESHTRSMTVARANRNIDRVLAGQDGAAESLSVLLQGAKAGLNAVVADAAAVVLGYICSGELHQYEET